MGLGKLVIRPFNGIVGRCKIYRYLREELKEKKMVIIDSGGTSIYPILLLKFYF